MNTKPAVIVKDKCIYNKIKFIVDRLDIEIRIDIACLLTIRTNIDKYDIDDSNLRDAINESIFEFLNPINNELISKYKFQPISEPLLDMIKKDIFNYIMKYSENHDIDFKEYLINTSYNKFIEKLE